MQNIDISKTAGKENLPGKFLKDGAEILTKPIGEIFNLPVTSRILLNACRVEKLKSILRKVKKIGPSN